MATKIEAGALTERVTLLLPGQALSDGRGGYTPAAAAEEHTVWARVEPVSAGEKLALGQVLNSSVVRVTIRQEAAGLTPKHRLRWQGKEYGVQSATPSENRTHTVLLCFDGGQ